MATTQHDNSELEENGFYSHDESHLRAETPERTSYPDSITLDDTMLEESDISVQQVLHGEFEKFEAQIGDYNVQIAPNTNGAYLRASNGEAVYRSELDYVPTAKKQVQELLEGKEIERVF